MHGFWEANHEPKEYVDGYPPVEDRQGNQVFCQMNVCVPEVARAMRTLFKETCPDYLRLFDGPAVNVEDMWRILGRGTSNGGLVVGTINKLKLGLQPKPCGEAWYAIWLGDDFTKNDEPPGNQALCQMSECLPEVKAMRADIKEASSSKLFSASVTADDAAETNARGHYCMSQFGPLGESCACLVDGHDAGVTAMTMARRIFKKQFLHYHRAGHGAVTSPQTQRGYTAFVHTKLSCVIGASGIHTGTMSFGEMEGDASDRIQAFMLQDDAADGQYYHQTCEGVKQTTPIISGGMNALRLLAFFENLGHSSVILTALGGAFGHKDGPRPVAVSCRQGEEAWKQWKAGHFGGISLSDGIIKYTETHEENKGAFLTFQKDSDQIYPGWKEKHGCIGESSVQAATFDRAKKASAAAFVGSSPPASVSLVRLGAYIVHAGIEAVDVLDPCTFAGMMLGAMLLFAFSSAAQEMVEECNEQFKTILQQGVKPDCDRCTRISTSALMQEMIASGLLMMLFSLVADRC